MKQRQPFHSNALSFTARDGEGEILAKRMYFSIGGGFVVDEEEVGRNSRGGEDEGDLPFAFTSGADLMTIGAAPGQRFGEMMRANKPARPRLPAAEAGADEGAAPAGAQAPGRASGWDRGGEDVLVAVGSVS